LCQSVPLLSCYQVLGTIERAIPNRNVIGIRVAESALRRGDRIAVASDIEYVEFVIDSLELDNVAVTEVAAGSLAGVQVPRDDLQIGQTVFRVVRAEAK
jgi:hypothetical protein